MHYRPVQYDYQMVNQTAIFVIRNSELVIFYAAPVGLWWCFALYPGRCPGLNYAGPSGLKYKYHCGVY